MQCLAFALYKVLGSSLVSSCWQGKGERGRNDFLRSSKVRRVCAPVPCRSSNLYPDAFQEAFVLRSCGAPHHGTSWKMCGVSRDCIQSKKLLASPAALSFLNKQAWLFRTDTGSRALPALGKARSLLPLPTGDPLSLLYPISCEDRLLCFVVCGVKPIVCPLLVQVRSVQEHLRQSELGLLRGGRSHAGWFRGKQRDLKLFLDSRSDRQSHSALCTGCKELLPPPPSPSPVTTL